MPEFWDWLIAMGETGRVKMPLEIYEEVTAGNDSVTDWLKDNKDALLLSEDVCEELVTKVIGEEYAADLSDGEIEEMGKDPFLIAYALADPGRRCVVSNESSRPSRIRANRHVPDVCADFSIPCRNTFALIRDLDFHTGWSVR